MLCIAACSPDDFDGSGKDQMIISAMPEDFVIQTRSVLSETAAFENKITGITFAAYDNSTGMLISCLHTDQSRFDISLDKSKTYRIVMLANMGDMTAKFPSKMSGLSSLKHTIASYSQMNSLGLPMVCDVVTPWQPSLTLSLRRLVAKLVVTVDKSDIASMGGGGAASFRNARISVSRISRALYPFAAGGSRASRTSDLFPTDGLEYDTFSSPTANVSEELVLYVPENRQGTLLPGNTESMDKSESNAALSGEELCTFISLNGVKNGSVDGVSGNLTYRLFPGADNVSNFDLEGGKKYMIRLKLTWDGMHIEGNWKVEKSNWSDSREIYFSLDKDSGYTTSRSINLAKGSTQVPVYIYYSPLGLTYEPEGAGDAHHLAKGWGFQTMYSPSSTTTRLTELQPCDGNLTGTYMSTGFVEHSDYWTKHYITIPKSTGVGYSNKIGYMTSDRSAQAVLSITAVNPSIIFSPTSMEFKFNEYGYESRRVIIVSNNSPVRPCNINITTNDSSLITISEFDKETGTAYVYWNSPNTGSAVRNAKVTLYSDACQVSAACTLTQQAKGGFVIGGDEDGGGGDIDY